MTTHLNPLQIISILIVSFFSGLSVNSSECELNNPYSAGSGHYAGFQWAETI